LNTCLCVPTILFFKERPKLFPSEAAKNVLRAKFEFCRDFKLLMKNKNYVVLTISYTMLFGGFTSIGAMVNTLVTPFGFTPADTSIFGGAFIFAGLVGAFLMSTLVDRN